MVENANNAQNLQRRVTTTDTIDQIKKNRDARRQRMEDARKLKSEREANNELQGIKVDVDFQHMVEAERKKLPLKKNHPFADQMKISVCFKKRPIFHKELEDGEIDVVSVINPKIIVHDCRSKVDGVTKCISGTLNGQGGGRSSDTRYLCDVETQFIERAVAQWNKSKGCCHNIPISAIFDQ